MLATERKESSIGHSASDFFSDLWMVLYERIQGSRGYDTRGVFGECALYCVVVYEAEPCLFSLYNHQYLPIGFV